MHQLVTLQDLPVLARKARNDAGLTLRAAAERLGVSNPAVSKAESDGTGRYVALQIRVLSEIAGMNVRGPLYEIDI